MGTKYGVPYFRHLAVAKLSAIYPVTLEDYYALRSDYGSSHVVDYKNDMVRMALSLARECNVLVIVPCCLWFLTPIDGLALNTWFDDKSFISEDGRVYVIDVSTKHQCVKAGWALEAERLAILTQHMGRGHTSKCEKSCLRNQSRHLAALLDPAELTMFTSPETIRLQWTIQWQLCSDSASEVAKSWSTGMEKVWAKLPGYYGLASWDELIATSQ
jgi:hypothetical protein